MGPKLQHLGLTVVSRYLKDENSGMSIPDACLDFVWTPCAPCMCRLHQERSSYQSLWQDEIVWGIEMRGPQIMRNIPQLSPDTVCCSMALIPIRKVKAQH